MHPPTAGQLIAAGLGAFTMFILLFGTFSPRWVFAAWVRIAFRITAVAAFGYTSLMLLLGFRAFPWPLFWALQTIKIMFLGVIFGILLLFFLSGEARRGMRDWQQARRDRRTSVENATRKA